MGPGLVIFDCDGVLVDSEGLSNRILRDALADQGLVLELDQVMDRYVGRSMASVIELAETEAGHAFPDTWLGNLRDLTHAAFERELRPVANVRQAVETIQNANILTCVASSGPHEKMDVSLGVTDLRELFEGRVFSAYEVARGKPAPDIFLHAANAMGISPHECVVIEDSPPGAEAAKAAGMRCLGYAVRGQQDSLSPHGAEVFFDMADLPKILGL